jgi:hypothetical protein
MAKTTSSSRGKKEKKIVPVNGYTKKVNGQKIKVKPHRRSTPN